MAASHSFYPDIIVTCEPVELADDRVAHPAVILEVLSESTADRDRGRKWLGYQQVPSLQQYVMLAQHERSAETFLRAGSAWTYEVVTAEKSLRLPSLQIEVPLSEIYARPGL